MDKRIWQIVASTSPREIVSFINTTFELLETRARVGEVKGIVFQVRTNEKNHSIPHVHAKYGEYEISISIDTGEVLAGNLPPKNQKIAQDWVLKHKSQLMTEWQDLAISAIAPLTVSRIGEKI